MLQRAGLIRARPHLLWGRWQFAWERSERAKGLEKASSRETVVQKVFFGEFVSSLPPGRFALKTPEDLKGAERKRTLQKHPFGRQFLSTTLSLLLWCAPKELAPYGIGNTATPKQSKHTIRIFCIFSVFLPHEPCC